MWDDVNALAFQLQTLICLVYDEVCRAQGEQHALELPAPQAATTDAIMKRRDKRKLCGCTQLRQRE